jgi:hypothetical protein
MTNDETLLWRAGDVECVMVSCCNGAELQVRRKSEPILRELYPLKSDLYERARALEAEFADSAHRSPFRKGSGDF